MDSVESKNYLTLMIPAVGTMCCTLLEGKCGYVMPVIPTILYKINTSVVFSFIAKYIIAFRCIV
jgi:hypothetical protein